jgi:hypothetical protein
MAAVARSESLVNDLRTDVKGGEKNTHNTQVYRNKGIVTLRNGAGIDNRRAMAKLTPHKISSTWSPKTTTWATRPHTPTLKGRKMATKTPTTRRFTGIKVLKHCAKVLE